MSKGFTLLEILVATTITVLLAVILIGVSQSMLSHYPRLRNSSNVEREASLALAQLAADMESLIIPQNGSDGEALRISVDTDDFPWLTFLARVSDADPQNAMEGASRAISYHVDTKDPIPNASAHPRFGLYRTVASAKDTFDDILPLGNTQSGYWNGKSLSDPFDLLADRLLKFEIQLQNADTKEWVSFPPEKDFVLTGQGGFVNNDPALFPVGRIRFILTLATDEGVSAMERGVSKAETLTRFSRSYTLETRVLSQGIAE